MVVYINKTQHKTLYKAHQQKHYKRALKIEKNQIKQSPLPRVSFGYKINDHQMVNKKQFLVE